MSKEVVKATSGEIVQLPDREFSPIAISDMVNKLDYIEQFKQKVLKKDSDYGIIPGTKKPTLYKAGAEKLGMAFNLNAEYTIASSIEEPFREWEYRDSYGKNQKSMGYFKYTVSCKVYNKSTGELWGSQLAECDSLERGRETAPSNTILKMAEKRAYVGAILNATFTSDRFTQDMEDYSDKTNTTETTKVSPQNYMDGFPSKYGTKDKPAFCSFCGENHVLKDDRITKDDSTGKYGSVVCKQVKDTGNEPAGEKADPRIAKLMVYDLENLIEIAQNTESEVFGDPSDTETMSQILSARYDSINKKILQIKELEKNSKGQLSRYINYLCDNYKKES